MSFTLTYTPERSARLLASTIHLSPSKRRRATPPPSPSPPLPRTDHSRQEIFSWVHRADATAQCCIRDIMKMVRDNPSDSKGMDFYWLGSVPCHNVKIVGMVVGIQVYEKKIVYTIDDGTGVLDCPHKRHLQLEEPRSKYKRPKDPEAHSYLEPSVEIGHIVEVSGKVVTVFETRQISVQRIVKCSTSNDELYHTNSVRKLHKDVYSKPEAFIVPTATQNPLLLTPVKNVAQFHAITGSPTSSVSSSPVKPTSEHSQSPIKLRHPSRLHTHDLTANTFRIYMKHYMDRTQEPHRARYVSSTTVAESISRIPVTPTKRTRSHETPRQLSHYDINSTPRPRVPPIPAPNFGTGDFHSSLLPHSSLTLPPPSQISTSERRGFTLSYLRRVPELSLLASRVVEAVRQRHLRAQRKKLQAAGLSLKASASSGRDAPEKAAPRVKRLYQWAIVELMKEGCIALWDGPVLRCPDTSISNISRLWKSNTSASSVGGDNSIFSTTSGSLPSFWGDDDAEGALSDPDPEEEAYIALTPEYLADFVENAIKVLVNHYQEIGKPYAGATKDGILSVLRKDDRWQYLGTWTIDDALEYLKVEERVWDLGNGRWDLTE